MSCRRSRQSLTFPVAWAGNVPVPLAHAEAEGASTGDAEFVLQLTPKGSSDIDFLFKRYSRLVLGTAYRILRDPSEAEEVVQEVFFYLCRKSHLFDESKGSLKAWIRQIASSRALDRKLYLARRGFYADGDIASLQLREEADLEQEIDAKLTRKHLQSAFSGLTARQRRTIEFFYFEGLDLREISEQLGEPLGRVRHHLYRGLERLRKSSLLHRLLFSAGFVCKLIIQIGTSSDFASYRL
jgi:RNA polymerase sigma-70 factor (ECF subfamily)